MADYSSEDDSSYASSDEDFEAPPPPPAEAPPADDPPMVTPTKAAPAPAEEKKPSPYNSNSAAAVAAATAASPPKSMFHHTPGTTAFQDPEEEVEELEITSSPTLKRINREERKARRKAYCHEKRYAIVAAVLLVLVAIAVALGVVLSGAGQSGKSVNIPDDFAGPDDFPGPSVSSTNDNGNGGSKGGGPSPSPPPTLRRDPSVAALSDYLRSQHGSPSFANPNSPQAKARDYVLSTLSPDDVNVLKALNKRPDAGDPTTGVQLKVGQLYGLAEAYYATGGDAGEWTNGQGWVGPTDDVCGWAGVTCAAAADTSTGLRKLGSTAASTNGGSIAADRTTHIDDIHRRAKIANAKANGRKLQTTPPEAIVEIRLGQNGLSGELPPEFGTYFPHLQTLSMPDNDLRGPLPESLLNGQLADTLQIVDLYGNDFTGALSDDLGANANLLVLGLGKNSLQGQIPTSLGDCTDLQFLELGGGNDLFGTIPGAALGKLTQLEHLALSDNERLVGPIPAQMFGSPNLQRLDLDDCNLDGAIPSTIGRATALTYVNLNGNKLLSGDIPAEMYTLTNLDTLLLYETAIGGSIAPAVGQLAQLRVLWLNDNNMEGPIPAELGTGCQGLVELKLDDNNFTGGIPAELTTLPLLERLHLHNNNELKGEIPDSIGDLTNLRELFLYSCGLTGAIPDGIGSLSNLVTLALNNNELTEITDKVEGLSSLQVLDLARNGLEKLPKNIGKLSELQELYLNSNRFEGDLAKEVTGLTKLRRFYAENNFFSGDAPDFSKMTELEELGLAYNKVADDDKFPGFEGDLPNLGGLRKLEVLRLHENSFSGEIDANYGSLASLTEMRLENNNLEGPVPTFWSFLTNLEELTIFQNPEVTGPMPPEICALVESGKLDRLVVDCDVECTCCTDCFAG